LEGKFEQNAWAELPMRIADILFTLSGCTQQYGKPALDLVSRGGTIG